MSVWSQWRNKLDRSGPARIKSPRRSTAPGLERPPAIVSFDSVGLLTVKMPALWWWKNGGGSYCACYLSFHSVDLMSDGTVGRRNYSTSGTLFLWLWACPQVFAVHTEVVYNIICELKTIINRHIRIIDLTKALQRII